MPTWLETPWVVLDNIRLLLDRAVDDGPANAAHVQRRDQQDAEHELWQRVPEDLRYFYSEILRLARLYTSLDDLEHYQTTRLTLPLRRGLRELGMRLVRRAIIDDAMDVFFAHWPQIETAVRTDDERAWLTFGEQVRSQKAAYLTDRERTPAWSLSDEKTASPDADGAHTLTGLAGSAGQAEGPAFIVRDSDDFARFPRGAVLIARTTNPTWTPLFYNAAAVVTESGGPLSHGAVTAREMRIPAVMSVRGILTRIQNGRQLRVDGTHGRVQLLD